jgi:hypothetical protein
MRTVEISGLCLAALLVAFFSLFVRRRLLMRGGGAIRLQAHINTLVAGRGWSAGFGRFVGDELRFYKMFSFGLRPKRTLDRRLLAVEKRRLPEGPERLTMPGHWIVLECRQDDHPIEIAMAESTVTGFLSWLEAGPPRQPGATLPRPIRPRPIGN